VEIGKESKGTTNSDGRRFGKNDKREEKEEIIRVNNSLETADQSEGAGAKRRADDRK
jgi:hypothetical protein